MLKCVLHNVLVVSDQKLCWSDVVLLGHFFHNYNPHWPKDTVGSIEEIVLMYNSEDIVGC